MYAIVYLLSAFGLIWYCLSPSYRARCHARWRRTPKSRLILEIGCGLAGLLLLGALLFLIFSSEDKSTNNYRRTTMNCSQPKLLRL